MEKVYIKDKQGNKVLPITHVSAVLDDNGNDIGSVMGAFEDEVRGLVNSTERSLQTSINNKVSKETGKGLSTNDYTNAEKAKLAELENYNDTQVRQLIAQTNANFANYYTKTESYSAAEVDTLLRTQRQGQFVVANSLPAPSADTMFKIYLVPSTNPETQNVKDEFVTLESNGTYSWEKIGTTAIDLSGYSTTEEMNDAIASALASYYTKDEINTMLSDKQDKLTFDSVPTKGSTNPVSSDGVAKAIEASQVLPHEYVTVTATANKGDVSSAVVTIYDENDEELATGEGSVKLSLEYGTVYKVGGARVYNYTTPVTQTFTAEQIMRDVTVAYVYIERDVVTLDQSISDPATMLSGDIQGNVIKQIRANSHLYLGTPTTQEGETEGTESICQLDDTDSRKYFDGTTAALDGTEGDQWMKLPVFWWKIEGIGTADANGVYDKYSFSYAAAGEPDPTWNKWEGDRNLLGAKEMTVKNGVGHSLSGGQSTGSFTKDAGNNYAAANNVGCQEVTWEWQWMMCMLFYAWYGNTNSQAVCGIGSNSNSRTLGVTDALGMTDTTSQQATSLTSARFWGLEAWWNCKAEWMGNVTMSNYVLNIVDMNTKQTRQVRGFVQCGGTGGLASRMRIDTNGDFVPVAKNATATTSYCDWVNSNSGSRVLSRSHSHAYAIGGVAFVDASYDPSGAGASIGSRLAFNGNVIVIGSVAEYKALLS